MLALLIVASMVGCGFDAAGTGAAAATDASIVVDTGNGAIDATVVVPDTTTPPDTTVIDTTTAPDTAVALDTAPEITVDTGPCPILEGGKICDEIPRFDKAQIVDGLGDEFCAIPATVFDATKGEHMVGMAPTDKPLVWARVAWSVEALHAHFVVKDPGLFVGSAPSLVWQGDSLELYVAGFSPLTGRFDDTRDKGAQQIVFAPATGTSPARAEVFLTQVHTRALLAPSQWAIRKVDVGYEIEVRLPWSVIGGATHAAGTKIALDLALNAKANASDDRFFSVYRIAAKPSGGPCGTGAIEPSCDDRAWCTPTLK